MAYKNPEDEKAYARERVLSGRQAEADARYAPKRKTFGNGTRRKHAHSLMRKYGMTLAQAEKMGVIPADVQEALHGDRSA